MVSIPCVIIARALFALVRGTLPEAEMAPGHDTRLLSNLLKAEKTAQQSFKEYTSHAGAASAALNAWSTADSGDTQDLMVRTCCCRYQGSC